MVEARAVQRREVLVFEVGGRRYGLPAAEVRELVRAVAILPLPQATAGIEGVINIRGTVVPVLDLRARLGLPAKPVEPADHMIVTGSDRRPVALRIDRALELVTLEVTALGASEGGPPDEDGRNGVAQRSDELVPLLDLGSLAMPAQSLAPELPDPADEPPATAGEGS
jgi:purine-binding chemotaxis protein CheW